MITLDFSLAIAVYIIILFTLILASWLKGRGARDKDLALEERFIWFCSVCTHTYINTKEEKFSVCPSCGSYNKR